MGPRSRFRVAAPGRLQILETDGAVRTVIDGSRPSVASLELIDVNAPDVSYDGTTIVFAGLKAGDHDRGPVNNPGAWRLYTIRVDGTGLRQLTKTPEPLDLTQFGEAEPGLRAIDDTDPAWLPDGRIVFSSTRWPAFAHYSGVRTTNLYVVNADGTDLHRITGERNGADRPLVDPLTGKIVYARWWRNHRFALDDMATATDARGGFRYHLGLSAVRSLQMNGGEPYADFLWRNGWQATSIDPDGTDLALWTGVYRHEVTNHVYGGAFTADGDLLANFFPMYNMTEASGFGGIRRYRRGAGRPTPLVGVTDLTLDYVHRENPTSYGVFRGSYATEPAVLPDGRVLISWAEDIGQDYGLYLLQPGDAAPRLVYDGKGTTELRARPVAPRPLPPVIPDTVRHRASLLPPDHRQPPDIDGSFVFDALNVYFNAPVDVPIVSAPAIGSAARIRFFLDHQRTSPGSYPHLDWPILLGELPVAPDGSVLEPNAPAFLPLFEQIRSADGTVPATNGPFPDGAAHVAGLNFAPTGARVRCVGCHAGHSMIPVPEDGESARWTNLAPGARLTVSTSRDPDYDSGLIDRKVMEGEIWRYWTSQPGETEAQWVELRFPVPIVVRAVRLYGPRLGDVANASVRIDTATIRLFEDADAAVEIAAQATGEIAVEGTAIAFGDLRARVVRVEIDRVSGTFYGARVASLAEIEVIGRGLR